jgi:hypothetical protein
LPQTAALFFTFHIEHIMARQHGGDDNLSNLALACPDCNAYKGALRSERVERCPQLDDPSSARQPRWHRAANGG